MDRVLLLGSVYSLCFCLLVSIEGNNGVHCGLHCYGQGSFLREGYEDHALEICMNWIELNYLDELNHAQFFEVFLLIWPNLVTQLQDTWTSQPIYPDCAYPWSVLLLGLGPGFLLPHHDSWSYYILDWEGWKCGCTFSCLFCWLRGMHSNGTYSILAS